MKTSTKNTIIAGGFTIAASIIGLVSFFAGENKQSSKVKATIGQSGIITINQNGDSTDTIEQLLNKYIELQNNYNAMSIKYANLENDSNVLISENKELLKRVERLEVENESLNKKLGNQQVVQNDGLLSIAQDKYLFDEEPYLFEDTYLAMRNNNRDAIYKSPSGGYSYDTGFRMTSNGENYEKGMSITPKSSGQAAFYYNLKGEYINLSGLIAFEDKFSERADKSYNIIFYCDDVYIDTVTIKKGSLPTEFSIDITGCKNLKVVLERPADDTSYNPNINLIEWKLY